MDQSAGSEEPPVRGNGQRIDAPVEAGEAPHAGARRGAPKRHVAGVGFTAAGDDQTIVIGDRDRSDGVGKTAEAAKFRAGGRVPKPGRIVSAAPRQNRPAIRRKDRGNQRIALSSENPERRARSRVPQSRGVVLAGGENASPVGRENGRIQIVRMPGEPPDFNAARKIPDARSLVVGGGNNAAAVGRECNALYVVGVAHKTADLPAVRQIPEACGAIGAAG